MPSAGKGAAVDLTKGNPLYLILTFALPVLLGSAFQQVYTISDTMIAGHFLGDSALAAIGASSSVYSMMLLFANGLGNGCGSVLGKFFGMGDMDRARKATFVMIVLNLAAACAITAAMLLTGDWLMRWQNTPEAVFSDALAYMYILFGGFVMTVAYNASAAFLRALGNSRTALYFLMIACALNLLLDVLMVVGLGWGVAGAALATVIAQGVSAVLCLMFIRRRFRDFIPGREDCRPEGRLWGEMASTGLSMGLMNSVYAIGSVTMQGAINGLGETVLTAHTAARKILVVMMQPATALSTAASAFTSQNRGAGEWKRIRTAIRQVMMLITGLCILIAAVLYGCGEGFIRGLIGTGNEEIIRLAVMNLCINAPLFLPEGVLVIMRQTLQALGMRIAPVLVSCIELVIKVLFAWYAVPLWGYTGASCAEPSTWVVCCIFIVGVYFVNKKKLFGDLREKN